jgi:ABC-type phosphate transport system substrate-binding protein
MRTAGWLASVMGMLTLLAFGATAAAAPVRITGAPSFNEAVFQPYKAQIERQTGTTLAIVAINSARGIDDLFAGRADIAMLGARLAAVVKQITDKRPNPLDTSRLVEHVLGESRIDFVVNPANPVKSLKREQLGQILGGRIGSWGAVGGNAHPILVAVEPTDAMYIQIQNAMLTPMALTWTPRSRVVESILQIPALIAQAPDAIGYMNSLSSPEQKRRVAILSTDVRLTRQQVIVTLNTATPEVMKVVEAIEATVTRMSTAAKESARP